MQRHQAITWSNLAESRNKACASRRPRGFHEPTRRQRPVVTLFPRGTCPCKYRSVIDEYNWLDEPRDLKIRQTPPPRPSMLLVWEHKLPDTHTPYSAIFCLLEVSPSLAHHVVSYIVEYFLEMRLFQNRVFHPCKDNNNKVLLAATSCLSGRTRWHTHTYIYTRIYYPRSTTSTSPKFQAFPFPDTTALPPAPRVPARRYIHLLVISHLRQNPTLLIRRSIFVFPLL